MGFFRALLHLYPASFRREFGAEMEAVSAARRRETEGFLGVMAFWLGAVADVVRNSAAVHWDILRQDLRYIARALARAPGFAFTAILVTALGVGANTAAFSVTDFVLIRPLPFPEPEQLVKLWQTPPGYSGVEFSAANYRDVKAMSSSFAGIGAFDPFAANLVGPNEPQRVQGTRVTPEVFSLLRVKPMLGRPFGEADGREGAPGTLILSYAFWQSEFGGDAGVLGRHVNLDGSPYQIIGIMPAEFQFPDRQARVWRPIQFTEGDFEDRGDAWLQAVGRLKPGVSLDQAKADLTVIAARLEREYPATNRKLGATAYLLRDELSQKSRLLLLALSGASLCILLIACANLGNLLLARGVARRRELAVRTALGAARERLVRQLITESLVLAGLGGLLGVALAVAGVPLLSRLVPDTRPMAGAPAVNLRVLAFSAVLTLVTCLIFAVLPALRTGGRADLGALREGGRSGGGRRERLRAVLVTIEMAASVVLLVSSGLLMRAIWRVQEVSPGFRTESILTLRTALPSPRYDSATSRHRFYTRVLADVRALPGVTGAAYVSFLPMVMGGGIWNVTVAGQPVQPETRDASKTASVRFATPGYFAVMDIPLLEGRDVSDEDRPDRPFVAVVSESFVKRHWPNEEPIGKRFKVAFHDREVVGVVGDIRVRGLERTSEPQLYLPPQQQPEGLGNYWPKDLVIRSEAAPATLVPAVRAIIRATDPEQAVSDVRTMAEILADETASRAVQLRVLGALAAIAFLLAGVGIHGLLSFTVSQRSQEIGVRMALGARARDVVGMVVGRGMVLAVAGILPGVLGAYMAGRAIQAVLFGVPPADAVTFAAVIVLCLLMAVVGCLAPALRAVRVDPTRVMKAE